jgi:hypothetical protein
MQIDNMAMTTEEFCESAGLSKHQVRTWLESGLLEAKTINGPDGPSQEFDANQLERARLLKALYAKGVSFAHLSGADLAFNGQAFVVFDGNRLRGCHDAAAAINVVCHAKRWCSAVDLSAIRQA